MTHGEASGVTMRSPNMDGSQLILWTETDTGSRTYFGPRWTERDLANLPPPAPVGELLWRHPAPDASPVIPFHVMDG